MRRRLASNDLRAAWERAAPDWIAWARDPALDAHYARYHRDLFLELLPAPAGRTLDLGCGEGRLARDLASLGHDVVGVDLSPTMLAAAREAAPGIEFRLADAASLPFDESTFALAVAFMSLQDVEELESALREAARVLESGGRLCLAIVHPLNSAGRFRERDAASPFLIEGSYLDAGYYVDELEREGRRLELASVHRPLQAYADALARAGLLIERLREPSLPLQGLETPYAARWTRIPLFLHVRAVKPA